MNQIESLNRLFTEYCQFEKNLLLHYAAVLSTHQGDDYTERLYNNLMRRTCPHVREVLAEIIDYLEHPHCNRD